LFPKAIQTLRRPGRSATTSGRQRLARILLERNLGDRSSHKPFQTARSRKKEQSRLRGASYLWRVRASTGAWGNLRIRKMRNSELQLKPNRASFLNAPNYQLIQRGLHFARDRSMSQLFRLCFVHIAAWQLCGECTDRTMKRLGVWFSEELCIGTSYEESRPIRSRSLPGDLLRNWRAIANGVAVRIARTTTA
jgi:hypothetical protein